MNVYRDKLSDIGKAQWDEVEQRILDDRGVLPETYHPLMFTLCKHWQLLHTLESDLERDGRYNPVGKNGAIQPHPALAASRQALYDYRVCLSKLGLTAIDNPKVKDKAPGAKQATTGRKPVKIEKPDNVIKPRFANK